MRTIVTETTTNERIIETDEPASYPNEDGHQYEPNANQCEAEGRVVDPNPKQYNANAADPYDPKIWEGDLQRVLNAVIGTGPQQVIAEAGLQLIATLLRKNADYGSSVFKPSVLAPHLSPGEAILVRLSDKIERLQRLQEAEAEVDESLLDTVTDMAGYCVLYVVGREYEGEL